MSLYGGIFVNGSSVSRTTRKWEDISHNAIAILPYFNDSILPGSVCRNNDTCGVYYRRLKFADVKFLKLFKNINLSKSFVITWRDVNVSNRKLHFGDTY